jgi:chromosome segregation ATPase
MSNSPADDERLDTDPTDELPILLETAVLDPAEYGVSAASGEDPTGEHTAHHPTLATGDEAVVDGLKSDLEQRGARIVALEKDISRLAARWLDVERHLTSKDALIDELKATLVSLRGTLDARNAAERRSATEIASRDAELVRVVAKLDRVEQHAAARNLELVELERQARARDVELAAHERDRQTALADIAHLKAELAAASRSPTDHQALREEIASLTAYIANRRAWWDDLEARAAAQAARIAELDSELAHRTDRQQRADSLAEREVARAESLREQLVGQTRRAETLGAQLSELRADPAADRATVAALEAQLAEGRAVAATNQEQLEVAQRELAAANQGLTEQRAAQIRLADQHAAALAAADERRIAELAAAAETAAAEAASVPRAAAETIARLESELAQEHSALATERATLRDQSERLAAAEAKVESTLRQLAETRAHLDEARGDAARHERAVMDKDRALEARDQRIATLQRELDQKVGALRKLNAMELSLQGLDSKMSERLRRSDSPVDQLNTPAFVCLSGDAPRQYALTKKTMTIGRSSRCDIQVLTHFVSREHARLTIVRGNAIIEDLGSTNGIFVNSARVDRHELRHGDVVTIGETQFRYLESMAH